MASENKNPFIAWLIWIGLVFFLSLLTALSLMFFRMTYGPKFNQPIFEIGATAGKAGGYSYQSRAWNHVKRGDKISAHSKIRTARESEVNFFRPHRVHLRLKEHSKI